MRKNFSFAITAILIALLMVLSGCSILNLANKKNTKPTEPPVILNERQIQILRETDLPTDYDELTYTQKKAIVAMEEMLEYADNKYNDTFCYDGYVAKGPLEKEHMYAYPEGNRNYVFTITRTEDGFEDDYMNHLVSDSFNQYLLELLEPINNGANIRVFPEITKVTLNKIPANNSEFDGNISCELILMVDGASCTEEQIIDLQNKTEKTLREHQIWSVVQFVLLEEGYYEKLGSYPYTQFLANQNYTYRETIYIQKAQNP